jgi:integrase
VVIVPAAGRFDSPTTSHNDTVLPPIPGEEEDIMIEQFFKHPDTVRHLRSGATGSHMDAYAKHVAETGFANNTARGKLRGVAHLGHWMVNEGLADLDEGVLRRFSEHLNVCTCDSGDRGWLRDQGAATREFLSWARSVDLVQTVPPPSPPIPPLIEEFEAWMMHHRNVMPCTLHDAYRLPLRRLVDALGEEPSAWNTAGIRRFIMGLAATGGRNVAKNAVTPVRMLLRYLAIMGRCPPDLVYAPPTIAKWRLGVLPAFISPDEVQRIIDATDISTRSGLRDRAMLLLMARLGLRAGDVITLRLGHVDWKDATITVAGKSRGESKLPLPQDVGDAILAWLADGRPEHEGDHVFLTVYAPFRPLNHSTASTMVARVAKRAGVDLPRAGSHVLRHSAATALLGEGMSLPAIGALLRHASLNTTAIYAKVDMGLLSGIARPWPMEVTS